MTHAKSLPTSEIKEPASPPAPLPATGTDAPPPAEATPRPNDRPIATEPRELRTLLDGALDRMERRARGEERPIPLPWSNLASALGGGLWGGTLVTLVGDTGSGKTQWALQLAVHAADAGVAVCYASSDSGADAIVARLLALRAGRKWSDLIAGRTADADLRALRLAHAEALKSIPFHVVEAVADREPPPVRAFAEWMRRRYPEEKPGTRPFLIMLDFVQMLGGTRDHDDLRELMSRAAREARQVARDVDAVVLFVSATARETRREARREGDDTIGIHRDRRRPPSLGRGNPARLVRDGSDGGEVERESDTVLVLAQEPRLGDTRPWTRVWCAVAKNQTGPRAWCALRFDGSVFAADLDDAPSPLTISDNGGGERHEPGDHPLDGEPPARRMPSSED